MVLSETHACSELISPLSTSETHSKSAMKFKLFNFLTICLATSGLLAPAGAAFGYSKEGQIKEVQHLVCVKEDGHLVCEVEKSREGETPADEQLLRESTPKQEAVKSDKATDSPKSSTTSAFLQPLTPAQQGTIANIILGFLYLVLPSGLCLGIFLYDKYCAYRAAVLHKQVEFLEKLWEQSTQH